MKFVNLEAAMRDRKIRQYELARVLRIHPSTVSQMLNGVGRPLEPIEKQRICALFGLSSEWLFAEVRPPAAARLAPGESQNGS